VVTALAILVGLGRTLAAQNLTVQGSATIRNSEYIGGNLAVGFSAPAFRLHIVDAAPAQGTIALGLGGLVTMQAQFTASTGWDRALFGEGVVWDDANGRYALTNARWDRAAIVFRNEGNIGFFTELLDRQGAPYLSYDDFIKLQRMVITNSGSVGIGTATPNPAYKLQVAGTVAATSWATVSAREFKQDISHLDKVEYARMLGRIEHVDLARYRYKSGDGTQRLGFIADELPTQVLTPDGKAVELYSLTAYGIGAIKALKAEKDALAEEVRAQRAELDALRAEIRGIRAERH